MRTKVWTVSIRIFHWLLAIGFASAYILSDFDKFQNLHYAFGLFVGVLILFRIIYGYVGNKYSNFKDFPIGIKNQKAFFKNYFRKDEVYIGHNPPASIVMICILIIGLFCSISGYMLYSVENPTLINVNLSEDFLEETHEILANLLLGLVITHLIGLFSDLLFNYREKNLQSIFTGYKSVESEDSNQNIFQNIFSLFWFIIPFFVFQYGYNLNNENKSDNNKIEKSEYFQKKHKKDLNDVDD